MRKALIIAAALAAATVPAGTAQGQGCEPDCVELDVQQALHQACHRLVDPTGGTMQCIESRSSEACIQVWLGRPGCLTDFIPKP